MSTTFTLTFALTLLRCSTCGHAKANGRELSAMLTPQPGRPGWMLIRLAVQSTDAARPLDGSVRFYLHPTFGDSRPDVPVVNGLATLTLTAWGAFTVGALADGGSTKLEPDLSTHAQATEPWRSR